MPKAKNIENVAKIKQQYEKAKTLVITDYQGLTHKQMEDLHKALSKVGAEYTVVKNSLLKIATDSKLTSTGPSGVVFGYEDELAPLKELYKFIKATTLPKVKMAILSGVEYDATTTARLASLPTKEGLISQLMFTLNANTQKLAYLLTQVKKEN